MGVNIDVTDRKRAEEHQNVLIAELDHRVKNTLASVAVVARRTSEHNASTDDFIDNLDRRMQSMAEAHALLSRSRWRSASLADLVRQALAHTSPLAIWWSMALTSGSRRQRLRPWLWFCMSLQQMPPNTGRSRHRRSGVGALAQIIERRCANKAEARMA